MPTAIRRLGQQSSSRPLCVGKREQFIQVLDRIGVEYCPTSTCLVLADPTSHEGAEPILATPGLRATAVGTRASVFLQADALNRHTFSERFL